LVGRAINDQMTRFANLPFVVDIVEWASSSDAFRRIIDEQAQPLRPATPPADR